VKRIRTSEFIAAELNNGGMVFSNLQLGLYNENTLGILFTTYLNPRPSCRRSPIDEVMQNGYSSYFKDRNLERMDFDALLSAATSDYPRDRNGNRSRIHHEKDGGSTDKSQGKRSQSSLLGNRGIVNSLLHLSSTPLGNFLDLCRGEPIFVRVAYFSGCMLFCGKNP